MTARPRKNLLSKSLTRPETFKAVPRESSTIWLDKNENMDPLQLDVIKSICDDIDPMILSTYPEAAEAYEKLGDWLNVGPESILFTPGSDGAIRMTFEAYIDDGDSVIHTSPTFAMYPVYSKMFGAIAHELNYTRNSLGPHLAVSEVKEELARLKPKLLCLPNPDSPTGTVLAEHELIDILKVCEDTGTLLLIDEAYHPFYSWSAIDLTKSSKNIIVARTFAKAWGAAGLRVGYAVANPETISYLHKMRPMYEVSSFAVEFVAKAISHVAEMEASVKRIMEGKAYFVESLRSKGFPVIDTHANFVHVAFLDQSGSIRKALEGKVLYRHSFDQICLAGYSRFTVAPIPIMEKVINLIEKALKGNSNEKK